MATEQLIVELDARTQKLETKLKSVQGNLDDLTGSSKDASLSFGKFGRVLSGTATAVTAVVGAAAALASAVSALVISSANSRRELELLAAQAKTSAEDFQALAFATEQYGISAEQIGDISKDISDKIGEFATAGTGAFQDYADVLGLTAEQARATAIEFQTLTSEEVIRRITSDLEDANATTAQTTFVLESLGNDLSRLAPLFSDNATELDNLKTRFEEVNAATTITAKQSEELKIVSANYDLLTTGIGNATNAISATLAPVLNDFFNDILKVVPDATQAILDFINSFLEAENIQTVAAVETELQRVNEALEENNFLADQARAKQAAINAGQGQFIIVSEAERAALVNENVLKERQIELNERLIELQEEENRLTAARPEGGEIAVDVPVPTTSEPSTVSGETKASAAAEALLIESLQRRLALFEQQQQDELLLLELRYETEAELIRNSTLPEQEKNALLLQLKEENAAELNEITRRQLEEEQKLRNEAKRNEEKLLREQEKREREKLAIADATISGISAVNKQLLDGNKAINAGLIVADAAVAINRQFKDLPFPAAVATSAAIAANAITQLSNNDSATEGGGSISGTSSTAASQPTNFEQDTSSLDVVANDQSGSTGGTIRIEFATDSGDDLVDALLGGMREAERQGR